MQKIARSMISQGHGGRIVNTASIAGRGYRRTSNAAYAASKGAVIAMTYIASSVLAPYDINVNAICPGIVQTDMLANNVIALIELTAIATWRTQPFRRA